MNPLKNRAVHFQSPSVKAGSQLEAVPQGVNIRSEHSATEKEK